MLPENADLEAAWAAMHAGEHAMALDLSAHLVDPEAEQLRGLAYFHLGQHQEAMAHLAKYAAYHGKALDWFNYANAAALAAAPATALEAFQHCKELHGKDQQATNISLPTMTWYFCKSMQAAGYLDMIDQELESLRQGYMQARITDSHYLYTRGLPDFEDFLEIFKDWLQILPYAEAESKWQSLNSNLDAQGKAALLFLRPRP